jgi:uncharacterized membrane protein (DUF4010 family)
VLEDGLEDRVTQERRSPDREPRTSKRGQEEGPSPKKVGRSGEPAPRAPWAVPALTPADLALGFGIALGVGALVGLERQRSARVRGRVSFGGIRTFPLLAMLGAVAGLVAQTVGNLGFAAAVLAGAGLLGLAYAREPRTPESPHAGLTTEVAGLLVLLLGSLPFLGLPGMDLYGRLVLTAGLGAVLMSILSLRDPLHDLASRVSSDDLYATVRFVLLAAVALPLLPDRSWDPYAALNPFKIGLFVALLAGVSFFGYVAVRVLGSRRGIGVTAAFGGLVSSTAVTLSFGSRARQQPDLTRGCAFAVVLASTIMFLRMLFLVGVVKSDLLWAAVPALAAMFGVGALATLLLWRVTGRDQRPTHEGGGTEPRLANPFRLRQAIKLGIAFAAVRLVAAAAHDQFGSTGFLVSAALSGLVDVDAITISAARMFASGTVASADAVLAITVAALTNTLVKTGLVLVLAGRRMGRMVAAALIPAAAAGTVAAVIAAVAG